MTPLGYLLAQGITPGEFRQLPTADQRRMREMAVEEMHALGIEVKAAATVSVGA